MVKQRPHELKYNFFQFILCYIKCQKLVSKSASPAHSSSFVSERECHTYIFLLFVLLLVTESLFAYIWVFLLLLPFHVFSLSSLCLFMPLKIQLSVYVLPSVVASPSYSLYSSPTRLHLDMDLHISLPPTSFHSLRYIYCPQSDSSWK